MGGWILILKIILLTLLGFAILIGALFLILRLCQRWIDEYYAKKGREESIPSAAEMYWKSQREGRKSREESNEH